MNIRLNVVSMKKIFFSSNVKKIHIIGYKGFLNIYPGHSPLLTFIKPSVLYIFSTLQIKKIYVSHGILEVQPKIIYVLPEEAYLLDDLNYDKLIKKKHYLSKKILLTKNEIKKNILQRQLVDISKKLNIIQNSNYIY